MHRTTHPTKNGKTRALASPSPVFPRRQVRNSLPTEEMQLRRSQALDEKSRKNGAEKGRFLLGTPPGTEYKQVVPTATQLRSAAVGQDIHFSQREEVISGNVGNFAVDRHFGSACQWHVPRFPSSTRHFLRPPERREAEVTCFLFPVRASSFCGKTTGKPMRNQLTSRNMDTTPTTPWARNMCLERKPHETGKH